MQSPISVKKNRKSEKKVMIAHDHIEESQQTSLIRLMYAADNFNFIWLSTPAAHIVTSLSRWRLATHSSGTLLKIKFAFP